MAVEGIRGKDILLKLNLLFGIVYLPWQAFHLRSLLSECKEQPREYGNRIHVNLVAAGHRCEAGRARKNQAYWR